MRIVCPRCGSEYAFQDDRLPGHGAKVKCSSCEHVFTVEPRPSGGRSTPARAPKLTKLGRKAIYLRQEGKVYTVRDLSLLQRWVVEKRVLATDEVSSDGETWEVAYRVSQLRPFFAVLRQLRETKRELQLTRESLRVYETRELMMAQSGLTGSSSVFPDGRGAGSDEVSRDLPDVRETREVMADMARAADEDAAAPREPRVELTEGMESLEDEHAIDQGPVEEVDPAAMTQQVFPGPQMAEELASPAAVAEMLAGDTITARRETAAPYATGEAGGAPPASLVESQEVDSWFQEPSSDDQGLGAAEEIVEPESLNHLRAAAVEGNERPDEPVTREQILPDQEPADDPVPEGARETMSRAITADHLEPTATSAGSSAVIGPAEAAPDPAAPPAAPGTAVPERPAAPEPAGASAAAGPVTAEDSLGRDFERFEESYEDEAPPPPPPEQWERDDFEETAGEADGPAGGTNLWLVAGAVAVVLLIVVGSVLVVQHMHRQTEEILGTGRATAGAVRAADPAAASQVEDASAPAADAAADAPLEEPEDEPAAEDAREVAAVAETASGSTDNAAETPEQPTPAPVPGGAVGDEAEDDLLAEVIAAEPEPATPAADREPPPPAGGDLERARQLARAGDHSAAIAEFQKVVASDPGNAAGHKGLGWSYIELGNNNRAAEHFRKAVSLDAMDPENHYGLGLSYEGLGRNGDAINEYQTYIGLAPDGREAAEVRILLRRLLEMQGGETPG